VDGRGVPLSLVVTGVNRHDVTQLELVLEEIIIERPQDTTQHLCADKAYDGKDALKIIVSKEYIPQVSARREEIQQKKTNPSWKARRWVVKVSHSWFNRFRKILVRYEKLKDTCYGLAASGSSYHRLPQGRLYLRISSDCLMSENFLGHHGFLFCPLSWKVGAKYLP